ncbi:MAG: transcriptional regulator [Halobacteriovoraceae bacterium]|nr:transcriptional regulator [Halobacteriovoraceae bacterium]
MSKRSRRPLPPLRALRAFEAAVRHGSFKEAAAELHVTPSAISHQIQLLEDSLGLKLFERVGGRLEASAAARDYAQGLSRVFDEIASLTQTIAPNGETDDLVVLCGHSFAGRWLQPNLPRFHAANPKATLRLKTFSRASELSTESFDLAICYGRPEGMGTQVEPFLTERLMPMCSPDLAKELGLEQLADLARATLIHSDNALRWGDYLARFGLEVEASRPGLWLDRSSMALQAAAKGQGVVLESAFLAAEDLATGRLIAPFSAAEYSVECVSYFLVKGRRFRSNPLAGRFRSWLVTAIQQETAVATD